MRVLTRGTLETPRLPYGVGRRFLDPDSPGVPCHDVPRLDPYLRSRQTRVSDTSKVRGCGRAFTFRLQTLDPRVKGHLSHNKYRHSRTRVFDPNGDCHSKEYTKSGTGMVVPSVSRVGRPQGPTLCPRGWTPDAPGPPSRPGTPFTFT